jgi:hypothetical protein
VGQVRRALLVAHTARCRNVTDSTPLCDRRTVVVKKVLAALAIAFVAYYLITEPQAAADAVSAAASALVSAFNSIITFFTELF